MQGREHPTRVTALRSGHQALRAAPDFFARYKASRLMRHFLPVVMALAFAAIPSPAIHAVDTEEQPGAAALDPDFAAGRKAIEARNWNAAIKPLSSAALRDPGNADIQNLLGFAHRNLGQLDPAFKHYRRALELNPRHRGAHEYIGEAYLMANNLAKAEEHLAALDKICLLPCEEYNDLRRAIATYKQTAGAR